MNFLLIFTDINAQGFIEKLIIEESNVKVIEERANEYLKKVKSDKENKLFQRWLYFAKIDADEKGGVISNRNYVNALHQYNYNTNFKNPSIEIINNVHTFYINTCMEIFHINF